jgi:preprotein translocase subunit SecA
MLSQTTTTLALPRGLDALWDIATGLAGRLLPRRNRFFERAERIVGMEKQFRHIADSKLRETANHLHERIRLGRHSAGDHDRAFALVREVADRKIGLRPFPLQVVAALAIEAGCIAEMATGEGKTLVATMPACLAGWRGRGCHVVTANEYLAKRDAAWMAPIYRFCGLEVAHIQQGMTPAERRQAYQAHITYCTNKEVAADFLRDRLLMGRLQDLPSALLAKIAGGPGAKTELLVQRGLETAIVDEADSVLIDEAVTPLIISGDGRNKEQVNAYNQAAMLAGKLDPSRDYRINRRVREVGLTAAGKQCLAEMAEPLGGLWAGARRREELVVQALVAREFFERDKQYIIDDGKVVIVDEFTGRIMPDRNWREGLHQAVEAKEGVEVCPPKETYGRISFQRFFRLYRKLSGMTGTGAEAENEFWQIYHRPVVVIPTHRPCQRKVMPDRVFTNKRAKWAAVVGEVKRIHKSGRPILIGTRNVQASESLSRLLSTEALEHQVLNAVRDEEEAQIVAGAGQESRITVATNMAGRGTDISLGRGVAALGGLHVIATERHEAGRIDRQLYGRCSRQGDPGSAQAFVGLDDELPQQYAHLTAAVMRRCYGRSNREISSSLSRYLIDDAQRRAERTALRRRKVVLQTDNWMDDYLGFAGRDV